VILSSCRFAVVNAAVTVKAGLQEENEAEEELLDAIATALTVVLKRFGDAAMPYVDGLMPSVGTLLVRQPIFRAHACPAAACTLCVAHI